MDPFTTTTTKRPELISESEGNVMLLIAVVAFTFVCFLCVFWQIHDENQKKKKKPIADGNGNGRDNNNDDTFPLI